METPVTTTPPPIPAKDQAPGVWAWIVIGISVSLIVWSVLYGPPVVIGAQEIADPQETKELAEAQVAHAELVTLELQGRVVAPLPPPFATQNLMELEKTSVGSDRSAIAVALLYRFTHSKERGLKEANRVLNDRRKSKSADKGFLDRAENALEKGISSDERLEWEGKMGTWFASLFPEDAEGTVPARSEILADGVKTLGVMGGFMLILFLAGLLGAVLLIFALVWKPSDETFEKFGPDITLGCFGSLVALFLKLIWRQNRDQPLARLNPKAKPSRILIESFAIYLGLMALADLFANRWVQISLFFASFILGMIWPIFRGLKWRDIRRSLGIHRGEGIFKEIFAGITGYCVIIPFAVIGMIGTGVIMIIMQAVKQVTAEEGGASSDQVVAAPSHPIVEWIALDDWRVTLGAFFLAAVIAPLFEEIMFRGALFRNLRNGWKFIPAALASGFIFAIIHPQGWMAAPALTMMGFGFALVREWRDSLIAPMVAHAINNGLLVCLMMLIF